MVMFFINLRLSFAQGAVTFILQHVAVRFDQHVSVEGAVFLVTPKRYRLSLCLTSKGKKKRVNSVALDLAVLICMMVSS